MVPLASQRGHLHSLHLNEPTPLQGLQRSQTAMMRASHKVTRFRTASLPVLLSKGRLRGQALLERMPVEGTVGMAFSTTLADEMAVGTGFATQLVLLLSAFVADALRHGDLLLAFRHRLTLYRRVT